MEGGFHDITIYMVSGRKGDGVMGWWFYGIST